MDRSVRALTVTQSLLPRCYRDLHAYIFGIEGNCTLQTCSTNYLAYIHESMQCTRLTIRASPRVFYFFLLKTYSFQTCKKVLEGKKKDIDLQQFPINNFQKIKFESHVNFSRLFFVAGLQGLRRTLSHAATTLPPPPTPSHCRCHRATPASLLPPRQAETAPSKQQLHLAPANSAMQTGACKQACSRPRALLEYTHIHRSKWYLNIVSYRAGASRCPPSTASSCG